MITRIYRDGSVIKEERQVKENLVIGNQYEFCAMEYEPLQPCAASHTAVVVMHSDMNYMTLNMGPSLAERGFYVLAVEAGEGGNIDRKIERLNQMIRYLRTNPEISKIVLMGHSGGATLMTAYQAMAENGAEIYQNEKMIYPCSITEKLSPADGIMLIDANYGNGVMFLLSLDPAVKTEGNGMDLDPQYDLFAKENGYDSAGADYSPQFRMKYHLAQRNRNEKLIALAKERLEKITNGEGCYIDDEPFPVTAANQLKPNNRMLPQDLHLLSRTKGEYDLIHADGSVTHEQIHSVRTAEMDRCFSHTYEMGADKTTVVSFLSSQAIHATETFAVKEDEITGVDWKSSYASPIGNIQDIHVPALFVGLTGGYEYLASEMIYQKAPMKDKSIIFIEGASHMFTANHDAEQYPGQFGDTEKLLYDHMEYWLKRFA